MRIDVIVRIPKGMRVIPPANFHLVGGLVKYLPYSCAEGYSPLPKWGNAAPAVSPHQRKFRKVGSDYWIKEDYVIKRIPCLPIHHTANNNYVSKSLDVFRDESLDTVMIHRLPSFYNPCRYHCPNLQRSFVAG
jgi:hypothetical protein